MSRYWPDNTTAGGAGVFLDQHVCVKKRANGAVVVGVMITVVVMKMKMMTMLMRWQ